MKQFKLKHVGYILMSSFVLACTKNNSDNFETQELAASAAVTTNTVRITNAGFTPAEANTVGGNDVVWVNDDQRVHTVTANDGSFDSGDIAPGASFAQKFTVIGNFAYRCSHHDQEKGVVNVKGIK
jgi:plastocyanin